MSPLQTVPVVFRTEALTLGYLNPSSLEEHLPEGTKIELPFWMASTLAKRHMVAVELPPYYNAKARTTLSAGPRGINLRQRSHYYFEIGCRLANLAQDDALWPTLLEVFVNRYRLTLDRCRTAANQDSTAYTEMLAESERALFNAGRQAWRDFEAWKRRHPQVFLIRGFAPMPEGRKRSFGEMTGASGASRR